MEFVTIYYPLLEVYQSQRWGVDKQLSGPARKAGLNANLYSMDALNHALENNINPLLNFAARKDYTAENILFLQAVNALKTKWNKARDGRGNISVACRSELFNMAIEIYAKYICPRLSDMPINISGPMRVAIEKVLGPATKDLQRNASEDVVTPFASEDSFNTWSLGSTGPQRPEASRSTSEEQIVNPIVAP